MSRTIRGEKRHVKHLAKSRKKLASLRQKYAKALRIDEWYIELPIQNNLNNKLTRN